MTKKLLVLLALVTLLVTIAPAALAQDIESLCLVTDVGRIDDGTFNQFAHEGALAAAEDFDLEYDFIESTGQTDYAPNIQTCLDEGFDIIVTVGFLLEDATREAAEENPDVYFIGVDQSSPTLDDDGNTIEGPENFVGIQFREDQSGFLAGVLAALLANEEGEDVIAGVYGIDVPAVVRFRNGYEQGAKFINPDWEIGENILGTYSDSFTDLAQGVSHAEQFIGDGAAVIFGAGGQLGSAAIAEAASQGVWVIGVDQDEYFTTFDEGSVEGAEFLASSAMKRVDLGVYDMVAALIEDTDEFPGGDNYILNLENGGIDTAPPHDAEVPEEILEELEEVKQMMIEGEIETGVDPVSGEVLEEEDESEGDE